MYFVYKSWHAQRWGEGSVFLWRSSSSRRRLLQSSRERNSSQKKAYTCLKDSVLEQIKFPRDGGACAASLRREAALPSDGWDRFVERSKSAKELACSSRATVHKEAAQAPEAQPELSSTVSAINEGPTKGRRDCRPTGSSGNPSPGPAPARTRFWGMGGCSAAPPTHSGDPRGCQTCAP